MSKGKLNRSIRLARRLERLGPEPCCRRCGETAIRKLEPGARQNLCRECRLIASGKEPFEDHHPAGRRNDPCAVRLPANDHAVLSDKQEDWATGTRRNRSLDFLHADAARDQATHDWHLHIAEQSEAWAKIKEALAEFLEVKLGPDWWEMFQEWWNDR